MSYLRGKGLKNNLLRDFPGGPAVKTLASTAGHDTGLIPGWGTKVPHATWSTDTHTQLLSYQEKSKSGWGKDRLEVRKEVP